MLEGSIRSASMMRVQGKSTTAAGTVWDSKIRRVLGRAALAGFIKSSGKNAAVDDVCTFTCLAVGDVCTCIAWLWVMCTCSCLAVGEVCT